MNKDDILRKIQKCMALARSSEPAEAAAALRQAQILMREHGVSELEAIAAGVREEYVPAGALRPSQHEAALANLVAAAFGCELIVARGPSSAAWLMVGCQPGVDIAAYTLRVLLRLLGKARAAYIKTNLKRCGPKNKTARADVFCLGWVSAVACLVVRMEPSPQHQQAIQAHMRLRHNDLDTFVPRERRPQGANAWADRAAGERAGRDVRLRQGVGVAEAPLRLGHGA